MIIASNLDQRDELAGLSISPFSNIIWLSFRVLSDGSADQVLEHFERHGRFDLTRAIGHSQRQRSVFDAVRDGDQSFSLLAPILAKGVISRRERVFPVRAYRQIELIA